jgi:putative restriction endonuclease
MKFWVGVTDNRWYSYLAERQPDEVNFWRPRSTAEFRAIEPGGLFLFKLHAPLNYIAGGGFFLRHSVLPLSLAWEAFGEKNGAGDFTTFREYISSKRRDRIPDPHIGCTILVEAFFWKREQWIDAPENWSPNVVQGKGYATDEPIGARLWARVQERFAQKGLTDEASQVVAEEQARYGDEFMMRARLGQGAFRVLVTEAYTRRCAISAERTLPVLEAAHIKPFAKDGPHRVDNGLLLRSDLHTLLDKGYITVTPEHRIEVSTRIREEFENGRDYYIFHGQDLRILPSRPQEQPAREYLDWHNTQVFLG